MVTACHSIDGDNSHSKHVTPNIRFRFLRAGFSDAFCAVLVVLQVAWMG